MPMGMDPMMGGMGMGMDPMMGMGPQGMMDPMMVMGPQGMMGPGMGPQGMMGPGMGPQGMMGGALGGQVGMPMGMGGMGMGMDPMGNVILGMDMGMGPDVFLMGGPGEAMHMHVGSIMGPGIYSVGTMEAFDPYAGMPEFDGDPAFGVPGQYIDPNENFIDYSQITPGTTTVTVTTTSLDVTGSAGSVHTGSGVSDSFTAGPGKSTFTGGGAADQMKFTTFNTGAEDTFLDFTSGTDKIKFTASVYTGFSGNTLGSPISANQLYQHTGVDADAADGKIAAAGFGATGRVAYDPDSGKLYYDEDGSATTEVSTLIAILGDAGTYPASVVAGDFIIT
jgi:hypothetical protein